MHLRVACDNLVDNLGTAEHVTHMAQKFGVLHHAQHHIRIPGVHATKVTKHTASFIEQRCHMRTRIVCTGESRKRVVGEVLTCSKVGRHPLGL